MYIVDFKIYKPKTVKPYWPPLVWTHPYILSVDLQYPLNNELSAYTHVLSNKLEPNCVKC